jgi:hypothetical protein
MSIFSKAIYKLNVIFVKIPVTLFPPETETYLCTYMVLQGPLSSQNNIEKEKQKKKKEKKEDSH